MSYDNNNETDYAFQAHCKGSEVANLLTEAVNRHSEEDVIGGFAEKLGNTHRTLQAAAVRVLLKGLVKWASDCHANDRLDARNEAAVKLILNLRQTVIDTPVPFI